MMKKMADRVDYKDIPTRERSTLRVVVFVHDELISRRMSPRDARAAYKKIVKYADRHGFAIRDDYPLLLGMWIAELRYCIDKWEIWDEPEEEQAAVPTDADFREAWSAIHSPG